MVHTKSDIPAGTYAIYASIEQCRKKQKLAQEVVEMRIELSIIINNIIRDRAKKYVQLGHKEKH